MNVTQVLSIIIVITVIVSMADNGGVPIMYETQSLPTRVQSNVKCHPEYIRTLPGILKIVEIVSFHRCSTCTCFLNLYLNLNLDVRRPKCTQHLQA